MIKNKVLIIAPYQFGELSDCYYWAKYASLEGWKVTYIGYKYANRPIKERKCKGVHVIGVHHFNNRYLLGLCFFFTIIYEIIIHKHNNIIACKFPYADKLSSLFPHKNLILDIRTLSIDKSKEVREQADIQLKNMAKKFKHCSVISEGVRKKLGIKADILPLGAECISKTSKDFSDLKLFYIGTFNNRQLVIFLKGVALFYQKYNIPISFDLVGGGNEEEETKLKQEIKNKKLKNVTLHGYLTHDEAQKFFDTCNVGVCYIPITEYYEHQPPTKLYEYLLSGMVCIATKTKSNQDVINENLGVLTEDNEHSICESIYQLYLQRKNYSSAKIVSETKKYHWKYVIKNIFLKLFNK